MKGETIAPGHEDHRAGEGPYRGGSRIRNGGNNMEKAKVYFTKEITPASLIRIYQALGVETEGQGRRQDLYRRTGRTQLSASGADRRSGACVEWNHHRVLHRL